MIAVLYGMDIHPGAVIGKGLYFAHTQGIVIGHGVQIGDNVSLWSGVTLGIANDDAFPTICDGSRLFAGCKVLGGVTVGENARVGANAVVLTDVPQDATAVGVPARILS